MTIELKSEILSLIHRINSFLERASVLLVLGKQNKELPQELQFNEQELKNLDNALILLATKLLHNPSIDENVWMPPVAFAFRFSTRKTEWSWLESFHQGLSMSKTFFTSYLPLDNSSATFNVRVESSSGFVIGNHNNLQDVIFNQGLSQQDMIKLADELSTLRAEMKSKSQTPEEDIAIASIASAEIAARKGDKTNVLENLKNAGKWAFDVATNIGVSIAAKAIEQLIK